MEKPSTLEQLAGTPGQVAIAAITGVATVSAGTAALSAAPVFAAVGTLMLPILAGSLANGRFQKRLTDAFNNVQQDLMDCQDQIREMTDAQFKFINETVVTLTQTLEVEKLQYLRAAVKNTINDHEIRHDEASVLSRIVRDISADEIKFIDRYFSDDAITFVSNEDESVLEEYRLSKHACLESNNDNRLALAGLLSLGLLVKADLVFSETYKFTPIVVKLLKILRIH